jgi:hypothetical protein
MMREKAVYVSQFTSTVQIHMENSQTPVFDKQDCFNWSENDMHQPDKTITSLDRDFFHCAILSIKSIDIPGGRLVGWGLLVGGGRLDGDNDIVG